MKFCPECGAMLLPSDGELKCNNCSYTESLDETNENYNVKEDIATKDNVIMKGEDINVRPTTHVICPECGHDKAEWWLQQTRSADEAETRFLKCLKCKHTWREYD